MGFCVLGIFCFFQSFCKLIGAGGGLHAALDALYTGDDIVDIHAFHQGSDALQVAVAAAKELDVANLVVFDFKADELGADSLVL